MTLKQELALNDDRYPTTMRPGHPENGDWAHPAAGLIPHGADVACDRSNESDTSEVTELRSPHGARRRRQAVPVNRKEPERYTCTMTEISPDERPRERLMRLGAGACSSAELLAILMRTGSSQRHVLAVAEELLHRFGGLRGVAQASAAEIQRIKGIGQVKAIEIAAAFEVGKRLAVVSEADKPHIQGPQDAANLLMPELRDERREHLKGLMMDTKNRVIKIVSISTGILDSSLVHPREVFREAIINSAASLILVHNHPSGDPTPSDEDKRITTRLARVGAEIGIELLDHIVLGHNRFVSMKEKGLL